MIGDEKSPPVGGLEGRFLHAAFGLSRNDSVSG